MPEDDIVIGVLGVPIDPRPTPVIDTGDDFGAISDRVGELCKCAECACMGVDSVEGTVVGAGEFTTDELDDGGSFGWGDEAARS